VVQVSRSDRAGQAVLVPFIDLVNHHEQKLNVLYHQAGGRFVLTCSRPVPAGGELFTNYGIRDNLHAMGVYGFAVDLPSHAVVSMTLKTAANLDGVRRHLRTELKLQQSPEGALSLDALLLTLSRARVHWAADGAGYHPTDSIVPTSCIATASSSRLRLLQPGQSAPVLCPRGCAAVPPALPAALDSSGNSSGNSSEDGGSRVRSRPHPSAAAAAAAFADGTMRLNEEFVLEPFGGTDRGGRQAGTGTVFGAGNEQGGYAAEYSSVCGAAVHATGADGGVFLLTLLEEKRSAFPAAEAHHVQSHAANLRTPGAAFLVEQAAPGRGVSKEDLWAARGDVHRHPLGYSVHAFGQLRSVLQQRLDSYQLRDLHQKGDRFTWWERMQHRHTLPNLGIPLLAVPFVRRNCLVAVERERALLAQLLAFLADGARLLRLSGSGGAGGAGGAGGTPAPASEVGAECEAALHKHRHSSAAFILRSICANLRFGAERDGGAAVEEGGAEEGKAEGAAEGGTEAAAAGAAEEGGAEGAADAGAGAGAEL
jgi:hypothetical protein